MSHRLTSLLYRTVRQVRYSGQHAECTDRELLHLFVSQRDEQAFAELIHRHGSMVLGVCQRVLGNLHDAEDAFQATFLTLARKAHHSGWHQSVGNWLYLVARRLAVKLRERQACRQAHERQGGVRNAERSPPNPLDDLAGRQLWTALDEELERLPDRYRSPLVLCYLEGVTRDEAARQLGLSLGTLKRHLSRGRVLLHQRLERRGLGMSALLAEKFSGAPALDLRSALTHTGMDCCGPGLARVALRFSLGPHAARAGTPAMPEVASARAVQLARGMLHMMLVRKLQMVAVILFTMLGVSAGIVTYRELWAGEPRNPPVSPPRGERRGGRPVARSVHLPMEESVQRGEQKSLVTEKEVLLLQPGRTVHSLAFSPDSKLLAGGCAAKQRVYVWEAATGKQVHSFRTSGGWLILHTVAFSPDGKSLAVASGVSNGAGVIHLWDLASGKLVRKFGDPHEACWGCAFSPDGKRLAIANSSNGLRVVNVKTGAFLYRIRYRKPSLVWGVAFSPDGELLASHEHDGTVCLRDARTGKELRTCVPPDLVKVPRKDRTVYGGMFTRLSFSPDGKQIGVRDRKGGVLIFDVGTAQLRRHWKPPVIEDQGRKMHQSFLVYAPQGGMLALGGAPASRGKIVQQVKGGLCLLDGITGRVLYPFSYTESGRQGTRRFGDFTCVAFSPNGQLVAAADNKFRGEVHVWGLHAPRLAENMPKRARPQGKARSAKELAALWTDLASEDSRTAFRAVFLLAATPKETVPFLAQRLRAMRPVTPKRLGQLFRNLDNDAFPVREAATKELQKLGESIEPALREVLEGKVSPEVRLRVRRILARLQRGPSQEEERAVRAVEILTRIGGPKARAVLVQLAKGIPGTRLTREARAGLKRIQAR